MPFFPDPVYDAAKIACEAHPSDIDAAVDDLYDRVNEFMTRTLKEQFVRFALRSLINDTRHAFNSRLRSSSSSYGHRARVFNQPAATEGALRSIYNYFLGGSILGSLTGDRLVQIEAESTEQVNAHDFNRQITRWLIDQGVVGSKTVREVVPENKLQRKWDQLKRQQDALNKTQPVEAGD